MPREGILPLAHFVQWLASGERGISSDAIVNQLTGDATSRWPSGYDHPHDPDDFRRCERLIRDYHLREYLPLMAVRSEEWAALVGQWETIRSTIEREWPGWMNGERGWSPTGYRMMREATASPDERDDDGVPRCHECGDNHRWWQRCASSFAEPYDDDTGGDDDA